MQGQRSAIGSLPDSINFDYGSSSSNVGVDEQIFWNNRNPSERRLPDYMVLGSNSDAYMGGVTEEGQNLRRWNIGESSSSNPQNVGCHDEHMTQRGWLSPINASPSDGVRLEDPRYEPSNLASQAGVSLNLSSNQIVTGSQFVRSSDSDSISQNHELSEGHFHRIGDDMDCPPNNNLKKPVAFDGKFMPSGSSSSDSIASSSGSGGYLVDEDDERLGFSLDGRRLSCKRKTLEGNVGQSSNSGGCFPIEGSMWHAVLPQYDAGNNLNVLAPPESSSIISLPEQVNPRLGLGMGGAPPADSLLALNVRGGTDSSRRNYRLRTSPSFQQDSMPNNSGFPALTSGTGHPDNPTVQQPLRFSHPPINLLSSPIPPESPSQSVILRVPALRRNVHALRWNGLPPNLRSGSSSSPAPPAERETTLPEDLNPRSIPRTIAEHPMFVPEPRSLAQNPSNWSLGSGGNAAITRNIGSSSRSGSGSGSGSRSGGPSWGPHRHSSSQYSRRLSEYVRRSLLSGSEIAGQSSNNNNSQHRLGQPFLQEGVIPDPGANPGHGQAHSRSPLWLDRQADGAVGVPYSLRALAAAADGRSRLVSEIRNALDVMRRGEGLRFEDVMVFDPSVFFGMADIHDQHRDMRLDVDNMSYEELLALEEHIGNVCTGLSEETISTNMKLRKYIHTISDEQKEAEPCCVCQEVYNEGESLGCLDCGHDFHNECIRQWLTQKNLCPICKTTGLATQGESNLI